MTRPVVAILAVLSSLAACSAISQGAGGGPISQATEADTALGRRLAQFECATCHASGEEGASRNPEAPPLRTLAERYPGSLLAEAFPERMKVGHPAMPEFRLSPSEVDALLSYLLSIQERRGV